VNFIFNNKQRVTLAILSIAAIIVGFFISRFTLSVGIAFLFGLAVINNEFVKNVKLFFQDKTLLAFAGILIIYFIGGVYSYHMDFYWDRVRLKLPFLLLPFGFGSAYFLSKKHFKYLFYLIVACAVLISFWILGTYIIKYNELTELKNAGKYIPSPVNHIRLSLWMAFSVAITCYFFKIENRPILKYLLLISGIYLFVFIHFFAVRSGILALYLVCLLFLFQYIYETKSWLKGSAILLILATLPFMAYLLIPSLKDRIEYSKWDVRQWQQNADIANHSDSKRLASYKAAFNAMKYNPVFGAGTGDIKNQIEISYAEVLPQLTKQEKLLPHNQFLYVGVGLGIIGLVVFCVLLWMIFFSNGNYKNLLMLSAALILLSSFLWEATIESQLGVTIFCLFTLLPYAYQKAES